MPLRGEKREQARYAQAHERRPDGVDRLPGERHAQPREAYRSAEHGRLDLARLAPRSHRRSRRSTPARQMVRVRSMGPIGPRIEDNHFPRGYGQPATEGSAVPAARTESWCAANPGLVPAPVGQPEAWSPLTRQLDTLNTCVTQVMDSAAQQDVHAELVTLDGTGEQSRRAHLRAEMHVITQVGQALRKVVPGIGSLRMPSSKTQVEGLLKERTHSASLRQRTKRCWSNMASHRISSRGSATRSRPFGRAWMDAARRGQPRSRQRSNWLSVSVSVRGTSRSGTQH